MVVLFDQYHMPDDIYEIIFATSQQVTVAKMLIEEMKENSGEIGKSQMSLFATRLHEGNMFDKDETGPRGKKLAVSYNKRQFYDRILTPMKSMGLIDYDMYKKMYKVSDRFNKLLIKIGLMWVREVR